MDASEIELFVKAGAKRWQSGDKDRLYINADVLGYEWTKYKTGNIHTASLNGAFISNSEMGRVLYAKTYIDCVDGKMHSSYDNPQYIEAVNAFLSRVKEA